MLTALRRYVCNLSPGRVVLWCYAIWYVVNIGKHFDPKPRLWFSSVGLSVIIGFGLLLSSTSASRRNEPLDRWVVFRLFLMPFCVSSFAALVKGEGYFLVFPPKLSENIVGFAFIAAFLLAVWCVKTLSVRQEKTSPRAAVAKACS